MEFWNKNKAITKIANFSSSSIKIGEKRILHGVSEAAGHGKRVLGERSDFICFLPANVAEFFHGFYIGAFPIFIGSCLILDELTFTPPSCGYIFDSSNPKNQK